MCIDKTMSPLFPVFRFCLLVQLHISQSQISHHIYHTDTNETSRWRDFSQQKSHTVVMTPSKVPRGVFLQTIKSSSWSNTLNAFVKLSFLHPILLPSLLLPCLRCITRVPSCTSNCGKFVFTTCTQFTHVFALAGRRILSVINMPLQIWHDLQHFHIITHTYKFILLSDGWYKL